MLATARRLSSSTAPVLALAVCALLCIYPLSDFDTFWHLANGRAMAYSGHIVDREIFSYTAAGTVFNNHAWLAQLIFYGVVALAGLPGLTLFKAVIVVVTQLFIYRTLRLYGVSTVVAALACVWIVFASIYMLTERPNLFSLLLLAGVVYLCESVRLRVLTPRWLWLLPLVYLCWDFLHGSFYGLVFLSAYAGGVTASATWRDWRRWREMLRQPAVRTGIAAGAATLLVFAINPYGLAAYGFFTQMGSDNLMFSQVGEFLPTPWLVEFLPFWLTLALAVVAALLALWRRDLLTLALLLPFAWLAVRYSRATAVFMLVSVPLIAAQLTPPIDVWLQRRHWQTAAQRMTQALLVMAAIYALHYKFSEPRHVNSFGWGVNADFHPAATLRFITAQGIGGNQFNSGELGGYLAWAQPQRKIFMYNHHTVFNDLLRSLQTPWALQPWNVNYALLGYNWQRYAHLFPLEEWAPVYFETATLLMLRRTPANADIIAANEIRFFTPRRGGEEFRRIAQDPGVYPRLMQETAVYLTYRADKEIADAFADLLAHPPLPLAREQRLLLARSALPANTASASLRDVVGQLEAQAD